MSAHGHAYKLPAVLAVLVGLFTLGLACSGPGATPARASVIHAAP